MLGDASPSDSSDFSREAQLIERLREALPPGKREEFFREIDALLSLAGEPRCAEAQADGVPCPSSESDCEECGRALAWLKRLRAEMAKR